MDYWVTLAQQGGVVRGSSSIRKDFLSIVEITPHGLSSHGSTICDCIGEEMSTHAAVLCDTGGLEDWRIDLPLPERNVEAIQMSSSSDVPVDNSIIDWDVGAMGNIQFGRSKVNTIEAPPGFLRGHYCMWFTGSIQSPELLQLSEVSDSDFLVINTRLDPKTVCKNLQQPTMNFLGAEGNFYYEVMVLRMPLRTRTSSTYLPVTKQQHLLSRSSLSSWASSQASPVALEHIYNIQADFIFN
ncbi:hypothetical protein ARMSODRAFT_1052987 [Armillaria solidipes]|uniref:Uncharacterized protein n=1 Tax=Armillaria solidipes TaxID=1076256 RepID=A0A2H3B5W4_9AGAR|nr:hypothetical protein ARMSODRAFT_1052987 [Armillaria solidipes]